MDIPGVSSTQSATDGPTSVGWRWGRWASQRRGGFDPAAISIPVPRSTPVWIRCRPLTRSPRWTEKEIREESEICQNEDVDAPQKKKDADGPGPFLMAPSGPCFCQFQSPDRNVLHRFFSVSLSLSLSLLMRPSDRGNPHLITKTIVDVFFSCRKQNRYRSEGGKSVNNL